MYYNTELNNGIHVIAEEVENIRSISLGIWIKRGSRYENLKNQGISHFIEHMLFKGTENRSPREIANEIDDISAEMNAFTAREYTCLFFKVIDEYFEKALEIITDIFSNPLFPAEEIERERQVILEEIKMYNDTPEEVVHDLVLDACLEDHPLAFNVLGCEETVGNFDKETLLNYYQNKYGAENIVVSVAGNIKPEKACSLIEKYLKDIGNNDIKDLESDLSKPDFQCNDKFEFKDIEQVHFSMALPGIAYPDEKIYQLSLLNNILGGSMSSRLFQDVRENNGLAYSIYSYPLAFQDNGVLIVYAGVSPENIEILGEKVWNNLKNLTGAREKYKITDRELERAKAQLKGSLMFSLESTNSRMMRLGYSHLLKGQALTPDQLIEKINQITVSDLEELAKKLFSAGKIATSLIGPVETPLNTIEYFK